MSKSIILLASIILTTCFSFGQNEYPVPLVSKDNGYHTCRFSYVQYEEVENTPLAVQKVEKNEELLDITDPELSGFTAAPNPTKGFLAVSISPSLIGYEIQVIDMTGRLIGTPVPITNSIENITIEGEAGMYLISIRTETEIITERILLQTH